MLLLLKIKAKAKIRLVGATPLRALGTQFREVVGVTIQFGHRFRDKAARAKSERSDAGVKKGAAQAAFLFAPRPAARTQRAAKSEHRRHLRLPVCFSEWSLPIQTFTLNISVTNHEHDHGFLISPLGILGTQSF